MNGRRVKPKAKPAAKVAGIPAGKSRSARARPHDWAELYRVVKEDGLKWSAIAGIDWDEHYVHALEKALQGRDNAPLFKLLDERRLLHPALYAALADVIRAKQDQARGRPQSLTHHQRAMVREIFGRGA
ncbi:MAG: hypothetical protein ABI624_16600, partial [Casimicrobiaceae bacterium]